MPSVVLNARDIRDEEVSYQGSRRPYLSRRSQEAWFTLG